ncbi:hypothetical protein [Corynebacterium variabile]|uniref:hypothetical protein n=1 Tax=Corynebacterium variabile TaxID=1727 RepID=UPI002FDF8ED3
MMSPSDTQYAEVLDRVTGPHRATTGCLHTTRLAKVDGDIDFQWEYTGNGWINYLGHDDPILDPDELYRAVRRRPGQRPGMAVSGRDEQHLRVRHA